MLGQSRRRPLVARHQSCSAVLDARTRLGGCTRCQREPSTAFLRCAPGRRSGTRPTGNCCSSRSRCSCHCLPWERSTTGSPCRVCDRPRAGPQVRSRFARSVALELALMVVIVGVTAVLIAEPPAKAQAAAERPCLSRRPGRPLRLHCHRRPRGRRAKRDPRLPARRHRSTRRRRRDHAVSHAARGRRRTASADATSRAGPGHVVGNARAAARRRLAAPARRPQGRVRPVEHSHRPTNPKGLTDAKNTILIAAYRDRRPDRDRGRLGSRRHRRLARHPPVRRA